jgi:hypothetical protein
MLSRGQLLWIHRAFILCLYIGAILVDAENLVQLRVIGISKELFRLEVDLNSTVKEFKAKYHQLTGLPPSRQFPVWKDTLLHNDSAILSTDYKIDGKFEICMTLDMYLPKKYQNNY